MHVRKWKQNVFHIREITSDAFAMRRTRLTADITFTLTSHWLLPFHPSAWRRSLEISCCQSRMHQFLGIRVSATSFSIEEDVIWNWMSLDKLTIASKTQKTPRANGITQSDNTNGKHDQPYVESQSSAGELSPMPCKNTQWIAKCAMWVKEITWYKLGAGTVKHRVMMPLRRLRPS